MHKIFSTVLIFLNIQIYIFIYIHVYFVNKNMICSNLYYFYFDCDQHAISVIVVSQGRRMDTCRIVLINDSERTVFARILWWRWTKPRYPILQGILTCVCKLKLGTWNNLRPLGALTYSVIEQSRAQVVGNLELIVL
jgi:hypothetical protein